MNKLDSSPNIKKLLESNNLDDIKIGLTLMSTQFTEKEILDSLKWGRPLYYQCGAPFWIRIGNIIIDFAGDIHAYLIGDDAHCKFLVEEVPEQEIKL